MTYRVNGYRWIDDYNCDNNVERGLTVEQVLESVCYHLGLGRHIKVDEEQGQYNRVFDTANKIDLLFK